MDNITNSADGEVLKKLADYLHKREQQLTKYLYKLNQDHYYANPWRCIYCGGNFVPEIAEIMDELIGTANATFKIPADFTNKPLDCTTLPKGFERVFATSLKTDMANHLVLHCKT